MCPDSLSPDNSNLNRGPNGSDGLDLSQLSAGLPEGARRIICTKESYHPLCFTFKAQDAELIAVALRDCGHSIGPEPIQYLMDSLRLGTPLIGSELLEFGLAHESVEVGESRDIGAYPGQRAKLSRELHVEFIDPEKEEGEDLGIGDIPGISGEFNTGPERQLNNSKLVFRIADNGTIEGELMFQEVGFFPESIARRWDVVSTFTAMLSMQELPVEMPIIVPPEYDSVRPIFSFHDIQIHLERIQPDGESETKVIKIKPDLGLDDVAEPGDEGFKFEGGGASFAGGGAKSDVFEVEQVWTGTVIKDLTAERLRDIMLASGFDQVTLPACRHLMEGMRFSVPLDPRFFTFIDDLHPASLKQEISIWFDPDDHTFGETPTVELSMDDDSFCGGLNFIVNTVRRSSEGEVKNTETTMIWESPEKLPATQRWKIVSLVT